MKSTGWASPRTQSEKILPKKREVSPLCTVTKRGQTVVPAELRRRYQINQGAILEWIDTGVEMRVIALPQDLVGALRGSSKAGKLTEKLEKLLKSRTEDKLRERS